LKYLLSSYQIDLVVDYFFPEFIDGY